MTLQGRESMKTKRLVFTFGVAAFVAAAVWAAQAVQVNLNGQPASGRTINGVVYVKLSDVAKAFDMQVAKTGGAYALVKAGGANQLQGTRGKLGEELFTGKWKFLVKDVQRVDRYTHKYSESKYEVRADDG